MNRQSTSLLSRAPLQALLLVGLVLVAYSPVLRAGFIWDDDTFLTNNPLIKAPDGLHSFWFSTKAPDYFPLTSSMLWVEWRLWGMHAVGYHLINVLLHAASCLLLWRVLLALEIPGAWLAALLYALHPVNVESVAWITERKNVLPMMFYALSIWLFLRFRRAGGKRWYMLSWLAFALALLSKTSVAMLPLVLLGCVWWQAGRLQRKDWLESLPFFALAGLLSLVTFWFQQYSAIGQDIVRTDGFWSRFALAGWAVWFYLWKAVVPSGLSFVYPRWTVDATSIIAYVPTLLLIAAMAVFWAKRKSYGRPWLFAGGYYLLTLLPVLGFVNIYFMRYSLVADHWQYTALIGIVALLVGGGTQLARRCNSSHQRLLTLGASALVALLCFSSWSQARIYQSPATLWEDTYRNNPTTYLPCVELARVRVKQGRQAEAQELYAQVIRILKTPPESLVNLFNLGLLYKDDLHQPTEAAAIFRRAIALAPSQSELHSLLGEVLFQEQSLPEATVQLEEAIRLNPRDLAAYWYLGEAWLQRQNPEQAVGCFRKALEIDPTRPEVRASLAKTLAQMPAPNRPAPDAPETAP